MSSKLVPLKIHREENLMHIKIVKLKRPPVGVVWNPGEKGASSGEGCQLRCHPRHLTMFQNYEVYRQKLSSNLKLHSHQGSQRLANQRLHFARDEASDWLAAQRSTLTSLV
ncbi:hypothetical protein TNCV_3022501 [Trichonephila clavipes]|nr:hypothetical protein TNCV_3022501 [Trichonephila clavipes]